jgi:hypothetical protein
LCRPPSKLRTDKVKAHGIAFSVQVVFAMWYIVGHAVLSNNDPLTFALVREVISACALLAIAKSTEDNFRIESKEDLFVIVVLVWFLAMEHIMVAFPSCV